MSDKPSKEQPSYQAHGSLNGNRRLFSFLLAAFILVSFGLRIRGIPLSVQLPFKTTGEEHNADDPRLEPYQNVDDAQDCAEWPTSVDSDRSTVSFDLLKGADLLFFLSRGPVSGHFDIIRKTNNSYPGVSKWITVEVATQYEDESDLRRTKVCRVGNEARNERGVLIWAERGHPQRRVNITVIIPLHLRLHKDITTDLSMFTHDITGTFADWWSPTMFGVLRFKSSDAPIIYNAGLIADSAFIQTSNAQVGGEFTGMNRLHIHTSNAPIGVYAWMSGRGAGSEVTLITSHGTVEAYFGVTTRMVDTTVNFRIRTSHAAVRIATDPFEMMSTNSSLSLDLSTSEAPVSVYLHAAYEGTYDLETTVVRAEVDQDLNVVDPSEMGRQRTLQGTVIGPHARGYMYWSFNGDPSEEGKNRGSVNVRTTKSAITVYC